MEIKCIICGKKFIPQKKSTKRVKYCSIKCKSQDYYRKYYIHFAWKKERHCDFCNKIFIPKVFNQYNCSLKCRRKKWKKKNWDYVLKKQREWFSKQRKINPEKYRWYVKNRSYQIRQSSGSSHKFNKTFSIIDWLEIKRKFNFRCAICNKKIKLTIDHIVPLSKGGRHLKENIQPLCHSCNSRKKDKLPF